MHVRFQKNTDVTAEHVRLRKHKRDSSLSTLALTLPSVPDGQNKHIQESREKKNVFIPSLSDWTQDDVVRGTGMYLLFLHSLNDNLSQRVFWSSAWIGRNINDVFEKQTKVKRFSPHHDEKHMSGHDRLLRKFQWDFLYRWSKEKYNIVHFTAKLMCVLP